MPEISPADLKPRESNVVERAYFDVQYAVAALAKSTKGITSLQNPNQALTDIALVRKRLDALEVSCQGLADAKNAEKAAADAIRQAAEKVERDEARRIARNEARRVARAPKTVAPTPVVAKVVEAKIVIDEPVLPLEEQERISATVEAPTKAPFKTLFAGLKRRMAA